MPETMGSAIAGFRDASAPVSLGIVGEIGKGIIDGALDAANYLRNVNPLSDQRDYNGLYPRMTNWDGVPLGGQEGLDRGVNGIMFFGSLITGGASAEANAGKNIWTSTKKLSPAENAFGHFKKHGSEFPEFFNSKQYVQGVKNFMNNSPIGTLMKRRANGDILKYHPETNTFGVMNSSGVPKTMFKPTEGMNYWLGQ